MTKIPNIEKSTTISEGAHIQGNVHTENDFAGRDLIHNYYVLQPASQLFQKLLLISLNYFSDHWRHFAQVIRTSYTYFQPHSTTTNGYNEPYAESVGSSNEHVSFNPRLFVFLIINIVIGYTFNTLIPERKLPSNASFLTIIIVSTTLWSLYSIFLHIICSLISGKGTIEQTISILLPLFSVVYVVSSVFGFVCGLLLAGLQDYIIADLDFVNIPPISIYFCIQFSLLIYYLPMLVKHIYELRMHCLYIVGIFTGLVVVTISILGYLLTYLLANL